MPQNDCGCRRSGTRESTRLALRAYAAGAKLNAQGVA
jgi:hypothetical protein